MEQVIHSLLYDAGVRDELPLLMPPLRESDRTGAITYKGTPELFAGYVKGSLGNVEGSNPESLVEYVDPQLYLDWRIYVDGRWRNDRDCVRHMDEGEREGSVVVNYSGVEALAVLNPEDGSFEMDVRQDDRYLSEESRGADIRSEEGGRTFVRVDEPRLYSVVRNREFGDHVLRLTTVSNSCGVYSLAFVSGLVPEMVSNN
jgi:hypothetical protein